MAKLILEADEQSLETNGVRESISSMLIEGINGEWKTIDLYNSYISAIKAMAANGGLGIADDLVEILTDINEEEMVHVGQLQKMVDMLEGSSLEKIHDGEAEATEQNEQSVTEGLENRDRYIEVDDSKMDESCSKDFSFEEADNKTVEQVEKKSIFSGLRKHRQDRKQKQLKEQISREDYKKYAAGAIELIDTDFSFPCNIYVSEADIQGSTVKDENGTEVLEFDISGSLGDDQEELGNTLEQATDQFNNSVQKAGIVDVKIPSEDVQYILGVEDTLNCDLLVTITSSDWSINDVYIDRTGRKKYLRWPDDIGLMSVELQGKVKFIKK